MIIWSKIRVLPGGCYDQQNDFIFHKNLKEITQKSKIHQNTSRSKSPRQIDYARFNQIAPDVDLSAKASKNLKIDLKSFFLPAAAAAAARLPAAAAARGCGRGGGRGHDFFEIERAEATHIRFQKNLGNTSKKFPILEVKILILLV